MEQQPKEGTLARAGSTVNLSLRTDPLPSAGVPLHHKKWAYVPNLVCHDFGYVTKHTDAMWACVHLNGSQATDATRFVVVSQNPAPGTRMPAYGVVHGRAFHPTAVHLTMATP